MTAHPAYDMPDTETWSCTREIPYTDSAARAARTWVRTALTVRSWAGDIEAAALAGGHLVGFSRGGQRDRDANRICRPLAVRLMIGMDGDLLAEVSSADAEFPECARAAAVVPTMTWSMHPDAAGKTVRAHLTGGGTA